MPKQCSVESTLFWYVSATILGSYGDIATDTPLKWQYKHHHTRLLHQTGNDQQLKTLLTLMMGVKIQQTCYSSIFYDLNQCICGHKANGGNEIAMYTMLSTGRLGSNRSTAEWHMIQQVMPHDVWYNGHT